MLLAIWDDGEWQDAARIAVIVLVAYLLVMWIAALVWAYRDIASRTRDPFTQTFCVLLVAVFNLPGLLLYLILRPKDTLADMYDRQLEAEALLHELQEQATCPACRRRIESDFLACPYCRTALRLSCQSCGKALSLGWVVCPYCGADRGPAEAPRAAADTGTAAESARLPRRASTATYTPPARPPADTPADAGT